MMSRTTPRNRLARRLARLAVAAVLLPVGCTSPPSVLPLLQVVETALRDEIEQVETDLQRDHHDFEHRRRALAAAFDLDLEQRGELTVPWVREAVAVYAIARETITRHEMQLQQARRRRQENLQAAIDAQRRAMFLLRTQDDLITGTLWFDPWRPLPTHTPDRKDDR